MTDTTAQPSDKPEPVYDNNAQDTLPTPDDNTVDVYTLLTQGGYHVHSKH